jgi:cytochrome P450
MTDEKQIPVLPGWPLVGNFPEFRDDRLDFLMKVHQECGEVGQFSIGPTEIVLVTSKELVKEITVKQAKNFEKSPNVRKYLKPILGNGLLSAPNDFHKRQRKIMAPVFQHKRLGHFAAIMATCADTLQARWPDGATLDIAHEMMELTLWIVGKTLFGADLLGEAKELGEAVTDGIEFGNEQYTALIHIPYEWPTPVNERAREAIGRIDETILRMISEARNAKEERNDLLAMLVAAQDEDDGGTLSDEQLRDECVTLFAAGHETTALALSWAWHLLTKHPDIYQRLQTESKTVLGGRTPTLEDLEKLPFALQVFKETLRLFPPAYIVTRQAAVDVELDGYHLPAGTFVMFSPYVQHHRADYFPDPEKFDPDRFSPERVEQIPEDAYIPFSMGPRVCIGNHFALMEGQMLLAAIAQRVTFEAVADQDPDKPGVQTVEPEPMITLRPKDGLKVKVKRN